MENKKDLIAEKDMLEKPGTGGEAMAPEDAAAADIPGEMDDWDVQEQLRKEREEMLKSSLEPEYENIDADEDDETFRFFMRPKRRWARSESSYEGFDVFADDDDDFEGDDDDSEDEDFEGDDFEDEGFEDGAGEAVAPAEDEDPDCDVDGEAQPDFGTLEESLPW